DSVGLPKAGHLSLSKNPQFIQSMSNEMKNIIASRKSVKVQLFLSALLLALVPTASPAVDLFNGKDLAGWRKPTGDWMAAKAVTVDPTNSEKFLVTPGKGILLNGEKGHSVNLISEAEFGDMEAHVEFWIPKHSNS